MSIIKSFSLSEGSEYIELTKLLKLLHVTENGSDAKELVRAWWVYVDGEKELRAKRKLKPGMVVTVPEHSVEITINA